MELNAPFIYKLLVKFNKILNFEKMIIMAITTIDIKEETDNQKILIPNNMRINDDKVYLKKMGNAIYIIPFHNPWQNLIESTESFTADFMENRNQIDTQKRESLD